MTSLRVRRALSCARGSPSAAAPPRARACARFVAFPRQTRHLLPLRVVRSHLARQLPLQVLRQALEVRALPTSGRRGFFLRTRRRQLCRRRRRRLLLLDDDGEVEAVPTGAAGVTTPERASLSPCDRRSCSLRSSRTRSLSASAPLTPSRSNRLSVSRRLISRSSALVSRMIRSRLSAASASSTY